MSKCETDESGCPMGLGMTSAEKEAMGHLVRFWNAFIQLGNSPQDASNVCDTIHRIQGIFAIKIAQRVNPEIWKHDVNCEVQPPSPVRPLIELPLTIVPSNWWVAKDKRDGIFVYEYKPRIECDWWRVTHGDYYCLPPWIATQLPQEWYELSWDQSLIQQTQGDL